MAKTSEILVSLTEDIEKSTELFGVTSDELTEKEIPYEFAKNWADRWFPERLETYNNHLKTMYIRWFNNAKKWLMEQPQHEIVVK